MTKPAIVRGLAVAISLLVMLNAAVLATHRDGEELRTRSASSPTTTTTTTTTIATTTAVPVVVPAPTTSAPAAQATTTSTTEAPRPTTTTTVPCQYPNRPQPPRAHPPDDRLCLTFTLARTSVPRGEAFSGRLRVENLTDQTVDMDRRNSCPYDTGLYVNGEFRGGGAICGQMVTEDELKPREVREYPLEIETGRMANDPPGQVYDAYAGVNKMQGALWAQSLAVTVE